MPPSGLGLHRWFGRPIAGAAIVAAAAGLSLFAPAAVLPDIAEHFGHPLSGESLADQAGLPGTVLGAGLGLIRITALAALPLAAVADRSGRRPVLLAWAALGLGLTVAAAAMPTYWWLVVVLAAARPLLTAANTVGEVLVAELTASTDRAKALALMAAAYGVGAGVVPVLRAAVPGGLGFRAVFLLAIVPLTVLPIVARLVEEPRRWRRSVEATLPRLVASAPLRRAARGRVVAMGVLVFSAAVITGPANTFLFVFAEKVLGASRALTATLVVIGGGVGFAGLLGGRALSDRVGRRPAAAGALGMLAVAAVVAYSGSTLALSVGYPLGLLAGSAFAPPALALSTELFPTSVRAAVGGWLVCAGVVGSTVGLVVVGAVAGVAGFASAITMIALPAGAAGAVLIAIPETRLQELEESAPEPGAAGPPVDGDGNGPPDSAHRPKK
ncbi:MFS transporter [Rhabdothermincola sp.]|uniref:MFS transporter n=1 Tax=Rhabdothermincola sp. TaxID=2820405 RepID=UPI002FE4042C